MNKSEQLTEEDVLLVAKQINIHIVSKEDLKTIIEEHEWHKKTSEKNGGDWTDAVKYQLFNLGYK